MSLLRMRWHGLVRCSFRLPSWDVVPRPNTFRDFRNWKPIETATHVAPGSPSCKRLAKIKSRAVPETTSQLAKPANGICQPPIGDGCAHPALTDCRKIARWKIAHDEIHRDPTWSQRCTTVIV